MGRDERSNVINIQRGEGRTAGTIREARGRVLAEGDEIILTIPGPFLFRVMQIVPVLDPSAPAGLLHVHIMAMHTFLAKAGEVSREFLRVRTAEEAGPLPIKMIDAEEQLPAGEGDGK